MISFFSKKTTPFPLTLLLVLAFAAGCATSSSTTQESSADSFASATAETSTTLQQLDRPYPNPIDFEIPAAYRMAVQEGTRTPSGEPGPDYWTQRVDYAMDVELIPGEHRVVGSSTITYHNNSPDTLDRVILELAQNVHSEGAIRKEAAMITDGMELERVMAAGTELSELQGQAQTGYLVDATRMLILPPSLIAPGETVTLEIDWSFTVPQRGGGGQESGRMGHNEDNLYFIAYWYPQVMVYDDVFGWFTDVFTLNGEFYHEFGSYDVNITLPEQWIVQATGELTNAEQVLAPDILDRYRQAMQSDTVVEIAGQDDIGAFTQPGDEEGKLTWTFRADSVNDFAFSASSESNWDGARTPVGDRDGDGTTDYTFVDAFYRPDATYWTETVEYAQHSITFLSEYTGLPYPWTHMSSVEGGGIIGSGMEFPMMTLMGHYNDRTPSDLYNVTAHEFAHMWIPMIVATNERRYSWIDEGTTTFNENQARKDFFPGDGNPDLNDMQTYLSYAGSYGQGPMMRWSDNHPSYTSFAVASYPKPATGLVVLRNLLGEATFNEAYRTFIDRWKYKHPYPWDLFNTFEAVSGRDLDWFWRGFYYETWVLDQAVAEVNSMANGTEIVIEDRGQLTLPAEVRITLADGEQIARTVPVETWLSGTRRATLMIDNTAAVREVVIDPENKFPDIDRSNNSWAQ